MWFDFMHLRLPKPVAMRKVVVAEGIFKPEKFGTGVQLYSPTKSSQQPQLTHGTELSKVLLQEEPSAGVTQEQH